MQQVVETVRAREGKASLRALELDPRTGSAEAARQIHRLLLAAMRANEAGVRRGEDPEHLHDFRVAGRRTRSALTQLKGVFPREELERFRRGFSWLSKLTGPTRDLDVFLGELDRLAAPLPADLRPGLEPLRALLEERRRKAHRQLVAGLDSPRYQRLMSSWEAFLEDPGFVAGDRPPNALRPIGELARERLAKAWRRLLRRGRAIDAATPAEALHRLRIDGKKLRYLLEFFRSLFDRAEVDRLVKALKRLQDLLGAFNDDEVQQHQLRELARDLDAPVARAAVDGLVELAAAGQERERRRFEERFAELDAPENRRRFRRLLREDRAVSK